MHDIVEFAAVVTAAQTLGDKYSVEGFLLLFMEREDKEKRKRYLSILSEADMIESTYVRNRYDLIVPGEYVYEWA